MNEDWLEAVFDYLKLSKKSLFSTPYFIIPFLIALLLLFMGLFTASYEYRTVACVFFVVFAVAGVLASICNEVEKGIARNVAARLIKSYGEENVFNDFSTADRFLGDKLRMGKRFVFANRRIIEIKDIDMFKFKSLSINFIPFYYMLFAECIKNGKNESYMIAKLGYLTHRQQTKEVNEIFNHKKLLLGLEQAG